MRVMVLKEKHGNQYINATTEEQFLDACLSVVKGSFGPDNHWWANDKPTEPEKPNLGLTLEQIRALPDESPLKKSALDSLKRYQQALGQYKDELLEYEDIQKCIDPNTDLNTARKLAKRIMHSRCNSEYEDWELIQVADQYYG